MLSETPLLGIDMGGVSTFKVLPKTVSMEEKWTRICVQHGGASAAWFAHVNENMNIHWVSSAPNDVQPEFAWKTIPEKVIKEKQHVTFFHLQKSISVGVFPILHNDQVIGLLGIYGTDHNFFTTSTIRWIESLAVSISYHLAQTNKVNKWKQVTQTVNRILQSSSTLKEDLPLALRVLANVIDADAALVIRYNQHQNRYRFFAAYGLDPSTVENLPTYAHSQNVESLQYKNLAQSTNNARLDYFLNKGYQTYVTLPLTLNEDLLGVFEVFWRSPQDDKDKLDMIQTVGGTISWALKHTAVMSDLRQRNKELTTTFTATIEGLSRALELRDLETQGHTRRVSELTLQLAKHMQIPEAEHTYLLQGALLHDIGKLGIPDAILLKPGSLTPQEWEIMKQHPLYAYNILAPIISLRQTLDIPIYHHERWNGLGYPFGLKGEQIPLAARLFAVVDVFDALTSDRPYRPAWTRAQAIAHIREQAGELFDPQIVKSFLEIIDRGN